MKPLHRAIIVVLILLAGASVFWFGFAGPIYTHKRWSDRVRGDIRELAHKRPPEIPRGEWEYLYGWTINLHANCGSLSGTVENDWRDGFVQELERRLGGPLSLADIDWIWDEYATHTKYGQKYSDDYRPTPLEVRRGAEVGCFGLQVD